MRLVKRHVDSLHDKHNGEPKINGDRGPIGVREGDLLVGSSPRRLFSLSLHPQTMTIKKEEKSKHQERKETPVFTVISKYFPRAIKYISRVSVAGNKQHHGDKPLHWDMNKSIDELDAGFRHGMEAGTVDDDTILHSGKHAWRAMAYLERELQYREDMNIGMDVAVDYQTVINHYSKQKATREDIEIYEN